MNDERDRWEAVLAEHRWRSGYFCDCGLGLNSPITWARHLFAVWQDGSVTG